MESNSGVRWLVSCVLALVVPWGGGCGGDRSTLDAAGDAGVNWYATIALEELPSEEDSVEDLFKFLRIGVLQTSCVFSGCHLAGDMPAAGLDLSTDPYVALMGPSTEVDRALVVPGDAASSYLMEKLTEDAPASGARMPLNSMLDSYQLELVRRWINAGAPNAGTSQPDN